MITIRKANVVLDIENDDVDRYMAMGFNVVDNSGNVIKEALPTDLGTLQQAYIKHKAEIEALKKEIEVLKSAQKVEKVVQEPKKVVKKAAK